MRSNNRPSLDELCQLYVTKHLTTREIAARYNVAHISVSRWLVKAGIPLRPNGRGLLSRGLEPPTAEDLQRLIHVEHKGYREIAELYDIDFTAITWWVRKYSIERPTVWQTRYKDAAPTLPTATELRDLYETQLLPIRAIGRLIGTSGWPVTRLLNEYGIPLRHDDGWNAGLRFVCDDEHLVRSDYELRVDNWLALHDIRHVYEPALPFGGQWLADFFANGWYIEVWGSTNSEQYLDRRRRKENLYQVHNVPLVGIETWMLAPGRIHLLDKYLTNVRNAPMQLSLL